VAEKKHLLIIEQRKDVEIRTRSIMFSGFGWKVPVHVAMVKQTEEVEGIRVRKSTGGDGLGKAIRQHQNEARQVGNFAHFGRDRIGHFRTAAPTGV
jgi:hypothetical protein